MPCGQVSRSAGIRRGVTWCAKAQGHGIWLPQSHQGLPYCWGREHAKLLTIANGRRRSKAVTEPAAVSETTVGGGMGSTTRENWANPLAVPSTADPGRPLSPLLSFVSHIFDSASDRLCRRLRSVRRLHDVDTSRPRAAASPTSWTGVSHGPAGVA